MDTWSGRPGGPPRRTGNKSPLSRYYLMLVKMYAAKRLPNPEGKGQITHKVLNPMVEYFAPSLEDIKTHLDSEGSFKLKEQEKDKETYLPQYVDVFSAWIQGAINSAAQVKARGGFDVTGTTKETLKVEVSDVPQTLEDLLATKSPGAMQTEKVKFLKAFVSWGETALPKYKKYVRLLALTSLVGVNPKAIPALEWAVQSFLDAIEEEEEGASDIYSTYLNHLDRQLDAAKKIEEEDDDWSIPG